jgi:hypothetical protein
VAHGTLISLYVARAAGVEPVPLWQRLGLPAFVVLALPARSLVAVVESVELDATAQRVRLGVSRMLAPPVEESHD